MKNDAGEEGRSSLGRLCKILSRHASLLRETLRCSFIFKRSRFLPLRFPLRKSFSLSFSLSLSPFEHRNICLLGILHRFILLVKRIKVGRYEIALGEQVSLRAFFMRSRAAKMQLIYFGRGDALCMMYFSSCAMKRDTYMTRMCMYSV